MGYHMCFMKIDDVHERTIFVGLSLIKQTEKYEIHVNPRAQQIIDINKQQKRLRTSFIFHLEKMKCELFCSLQYNFISFTFSEYMLLFEHLQNRFSLKKEPCMECMFQELRTFRRFNFKTDKTF